MRETLAQLEATIGLKNILVWHCNDAKRRVDRSWIDISISEGSIGLEAFRDYSMIPIAHAAFIAETPIDERAMIREMSQR